MLSNSYHKGYFSYRREHILLSSKPQLSSPIEVLHIE